MMRREELIRLYHSAMTKVPYGRFYRPGTTWKQAARFVDQLMAADDNGAKKRDDEIGQQ